MGTVLNLLFVVLFVTVIYGFPQQHPASTTSKKPNFKTLPDKTNIQKQDTNNQNKHRAVRDTQEQSKPLDRSQISTLPATVDLKKKDTVPQNEDHNRKVRDTTGPPAKPLDRSQISTLPQTVDIKKQDTVPQKDDQNRKTRDVDAVPKPLDSTQSSTSSVDLKKEDAVAPKDAENQSTPLDKSQISTSPATTDIKKDDSAKSSEESHSRQTRGAENSKQRSNPGDVKTDSYRANPHLAASNPHSTRDLPKPLAQPSHAVTPKNAPLPSSNNRPHPGVDTHNSQHH